MEQQRPEYYEEDEITLKELIFKIQEFWREVWKHKFLVILVAGVFALGFLLKAWMTPAVYPATLTFMVNEDEGGGGGGVASILGQFGFGGGGGGKYNLDKLLELARSRKIIAMALFEKIEIDGKMDYIANHIIDLYNFHEAWEKDTTGFKNFYFKDDQVNNFNRIENSVLKSVFSRVVGNSKAGIEGIANSGYQEDTGIMNISSKSISEILSISLTLTIYEKLSSYYIEKTIAKHQKTYDLFKAKVDSIESVLNNAQFNLLKFDDNNRMLSLQQYTFKRQQLQQEVQKMIMAYGEVYKNLELSEFALKNKTPFITTIDEPMAPIYPSSESKVKAIIIGGILGVFLSIGVIIGRKIYRDTMESP